MNIKNKPNYKLIYKDFIQRKYPDKAALCTPFFNKVFWTDLDVIYLNDLLLNKEKKPISLNQKFKAYDEETILEILHYQLKNDLNNSQLATHFNISRNTVHKWKKIFFGG